MSPEDDAPAQAPEPEVHEVESLEEPAREGNGEAAPEAPPEAPEDPPKEGLLCSVTIEIYKDRRLLNGPLQTNRTGMRGALEWALDYLKHQDEMDLLEEKMRAQQGIMQRLMLEAQSQVQPVRGGFPGPPQALRKMRN